MTDITDLICDLERRCDIIEEKIVYGDIDALRAENEVLRKVAEAASSVLSEDGVKEFLSSWVMGVELIDRIATLPPRKS